MKDQDVYLFGLIVRTNAFRFDHEYLSMDRYHEYAEKEVFFGGEVGTAAIVLSSLGLSVKLTGNHIDSHLKEMFLSFYEPFHIDVSSIVFEKGLEDFEDYVFITKKARTIVGGLDTYFARCNEKHLHPWNTPVEEEITKASAAGIDPYFGNESRKAAILCSQFHVPFVTFDVPPEDPLFRLASIIILSGEYLRNSYTQLNTQERVSALLRFQKETDALIIITDGDKEIVYGRDGRVHSIPSFPVKVISTLGAGDAFRAACIYGTVKGWDEDRIVRFAAGCAGIACTRFPIWSRPPSLHDVECLIGNSKLEGI